MEQLSLWGDDQKSKLVAVPAQRVEATPEPAQPAQPAQKVATTPETTTPEPKKARARRAKSAAAEEGDEMGGSLEDWKEPNRTRYEESGEEERATRDRLFAWGRDHGFPTLRFQHSGGVPRMTYYPYIASGEPCWRLFRDHHRDDEIYAGVNFCQACDRGEATIDHYFAGW